MQLSVLHVAHKVFEVHYLLATALAVETTLIHNFIWHECWTWKMRGQPGIGMRFVRYQFGTGSVAMTSNLFGMRFFMGQMGLHHLIASPLSIMTSGIINFCLGEFFVFRKRRATKPQPSGTG